MKEPKESRTGAFVAGVIVGAFAGAVTALLLLDDDEGSDAAPAHAAARASDPEPVAGADARHAGDDERHMN